jgi:peroxiredoxin Q/BCP
MINKLNDLKDFKLAGIDSEGKEVMFNLADYVGQNVVLYFYPKDNTPGCTQEACDFRDNINRLTGKAVVFGVSPDSIKSHINFKQKHDINFALISDEDKKLSQAFGAWGQKSFLGKKYMGIIRSTFLFGKTGALSKEWREVKVKGHVEEVLSSMR